jgi:hypothetical protein
LLSLPFATAANKIPPSGYGLKLKRAVSPLADPTPAESDGHRESSVELTGC